MNPEIDKLITVSRLAFFWIGALSMAAIYVGAFVWWLWAA